MDKTSWALLVFLVSVIGIVIAFPVDNEPDYEAYDKCVKLHPDRYCRIASGFPVKPLDEIRD